MTNFDDPDNPLRYRFGVIGSTDTHQGAPGVGYKEAKQFADHFGPAEPRFDQRNRVLLTSLLSDWERTGSFWYTGALVAVHSQARDRQNIWEALKRREVYATSGPRILLWFDLVNGPHAEHYPMGSEVQLDETPRFEVRATGSFRQKPGCRRKRARKHPKGSSNSTASVLDREQGDQGLDGTQRRWGLDQIIADELLLQRALELGLARADPLARRRLVAAS